MICLMLLRKQVNHVDIVQCTLDLSDMILNSLIRLSGGVSCRSFTKVTACSKFSGVLSNIRLSIVTPVIITRTVQTSVIHNSSDDTPFMKQRLSKLGGKSKMYKLMEKDGLGPDYQLIYRLGLESYVTPAKWFGFAAGVGFLVSIPLNMSLSNGPVYMGGSSSLIDATNPWEFIIFSIILAGHAVGCTYASFVLPLRAYYCSQEDNFVVVMNTLLPWKSKLVKLQPGELFPQEGRRDLMNFARYRHVVIPTKNIVYMPSNYFATNYYYRKITGTLIEEDYEEGY